MPDQELSFLGRSALRTLKRLRFPGILDQMVTSYPSEQNALDIFKNEWSSKLPLARSDLQAGPIPLFEDPRVHWAVCEAGGVANQRVLELGPLEGGHTYMLQERGAASILAIEANTRAFLKCLIVKNIFNLHKADFRCGDFISFLRQNTERFDFVLATGVLYHMTSPVELLQLLSRVTDRLFMWTHYYDEAIISGNPNVLRLMAGSTKNTHAGFTHTLHRYEYKDALKVAFTGGTKSHSCWMERDEILACLHYFGYGDIRIAFDEPDHLHGPCFAVLAQR